MIRAIDSDLHVRETVRTLEEALEDARAGRLSTVVVFADMRGENALRMYKSTVFDRFVLIGRLMSGVFDLCEAKKEGG